MVRIPGISSIAVGPVNKSSATTGSLASRLSLPIGGARCFACSRKGRVAACWVTHYARWRETCRPGFPSHRPGSNEMSKAEARLIASDGTQLLFLNRKLHMTYAHTNMFCMYIYIYIYIYNNCLTCLVTAAASAFKAVGASGK